eukprot:1401094-Prymnesium_polylepis.2
MQLIFERCFNDNAQVAHNLAVTAQSRVRPLGDGLVDHVTKRSQNRVSVGGTAPRRVALGWTHARVSRLAAQGWSALAIGTVSTVFSRTSSYKK